MTLLELWAVVALTSTDFSIIHRLYLQRGFLSLNALFFVPCFLAYLNHLADFTLLRIYVNEAFFSKCLWSLLASDITIKSCYLYQSLFLFAQNAKILTRIDLMSQMLSNKRDSNLNISFFLNLANRHHIAFLSW